jgi:hypothetical protein
MTTTAAPDAATSVTHRIRSYAEIDGGRRYLLGLALGFYLPHLLEEAITGMHDDTLIVAAYDLVAPLGPRHAAYLVFQVTFALGLVMTVLLDRGVRGRVLVLGGLGIALLAETHHVVRAIVMHAYNSGLVTALPLPWIGLRLLRQASFEARAHTRAP